MKITVNSVAPKVSKSNKTYQEVTFNGSDKASAWDDDFIPLIGKEVEVEIQTKGNFKNIKLVSVPTSAPEPAKPANLGGDELRKVALMVGSDNAFKMGKTVTLEILKENIAFCEDYLRNGFAKS